MELTIYEEENVNIEDMKKNLKDEIPKPIDHTIKRYNDIVQSINAYEDNLTSLTPYQLSVLKHYYNKAEREAWKVAGYYKSQYQFYNGKAATERGQFYIHERDKHNVNDSNYRSKVHEGKNLEIAGIYEGYYVTWKGIAESMRGMQTSYRDMINSIDMES